MSAPAGKRRIMRGLVIKEISLVDRPAQVGADVVVQKGDDVNKRMPSPRKGESEADFVSRCMGDSTMMSEYPDEKQRAAVAHRRFRGTDKRGDVDKARFATITSNVDGHSHLIDETKYAYSSDKDVLAGMTTYAASEGATMSHAHPWTVDADGKVTIGEAEGHTHDVEPEAMLRALRAYLAGVARDEVNKADDAAEQDQPADGAGGDAAAQDAANENAAGEPGGTEQDMGNPTAVPKTAEGSAGDAGRVAELEKRLARSEAFGALDDAGKAYCKALSPAEEDAFLALPLAERNAQVAKAVAANEVVYKAADGTEFRKNDDPRLVAMAKRADAAAASAAAQAAKAEAFELAKRAEDTIPHLPGSDAVKVALLKAVDSIADEAVRKDAHAALTAGSNALAPAFRTFGKVGGSVGNADDPEAKLEELAKARAAKDGVPFSKAYRAVLNSPEGRELYARSVQEVA